MKRFFNPSPSIVKPIDLVVAITGKTVEELRLPERAVITFDTADTRHLVNDSDAKPIRAWSKFRPIYRREDTNTVVTRCFFGAPNIAALVEEFAAFGVREFFLVGYCGALDHALALGDVLVVRKALREEGVSYHYMDTEDEYVTSDWFDEWYRKLSGYGFKEGIVWSNDAIYRETVEKVDGFRKEGISAVEMEVASFYAVCNFLSVRGIAFLVVSDLLHQEGWNAGFQEKEVAEGRSRLFKCIEQTVMKTGTPGIGKTGRK